MLQQKTTVEVRKLWSKTTTNSKCAYCITVHELKLFDSCCLTISSSFGTR